MRIKLAWALFGAVLFPGVLALAAGPADDDTGSLACSNAHATQLLQKGFQLQKDNNTPVALSTYEKCLASDPNCVDCLYEIGWSYWKMGEWDSVIQTWKKALVLQPEHKKIIQFLPTAIANKDLLKGHKGDRIFRTKTNLLKESQPAEGPLQILQVARWQSYNPNPESALDHYDMDIESPKSVVFSSDGLKAYVNSLEGSKTVVFNSSGLEKLAVISHVFTDDDADHVDHRPPFDYQFRHKQPWIFKGKPVESVVTHAGRFLWSTYYRRDFDALGTEPSAMAVIDTVTNRILRVMGTGSISKYIAVSVDNHWLAVSNWGDNTIGLYDLRAPQVKDFKSSQLLVVEKRLSMKNLKQNRDKDCGFCVRGVTFTQDGKYLLVGRMKGGGIAVFDLDGIEEGKPALYRGTVFGLQPGPRDLHLSKDGQTLFIGCNSTGTLTKISVQPLIDLVRNKIGASVEIPGSLPYLKKFVGLGVRSFKLSPDEKYIFVAVNNSSEVAVVSTADLSVLARIPVDSYPVGLSVSPDGSRLWVTSQGKDHLGGNSVAIYQIIDRLENNIHEVK